MQLKDFIYFGENGEVSSSGPLYYSKYHYTKCSSENIGIRIIKVDSEGVHIPTLWQMQVIGKMHGINITDHESGYSEYEHETGRFTPDTLDQYFKELAYLAAWYGCETMELKCLTKALFWNYESAKSVDTLPLDDFHKLYVRLYKSGYKKCAKWLLRFHRKNLSELMSRRFWL